jgi:hypothetical protein
MRIPILVPRPPVELALAHAGLLTALDAFRIQESSGF